MSLGFLIGALIGILIGYFSYRTRVRLAEEEAEVCRAQLDRIRALILSIRIRGNIPRSGKTCQH